MLFPHKGEFSPSNNPHSLDFEIRFISEYSLFAKCIFSEAIMESLDESI